MKKRWGSAAAAVFCAAFAFLSCSFHHEVPAVENEEYSSFITCVDWENESGGKLSFSHDGTGKLCGTPLSWEQNGRTIEYVFFPEASVGRSGVISEFIYNSIPVLHTGREKYLISDFIPKKAQEEAGEEEPEKEEPSPEELIAQEGQTAANLAFGFIGWNYKYGGKTPETGFDCSGLVYYIYEQLGYRLERVANYQAKQGILIDGEDAQPGDILCFGAPDYCSHVGIYVGQGYYIHAMGSEFGVVATSLDDPYLKRPKYEVRRIAGCDWLKAENIDAALAAGLPTPTPPPEISEEQTDSGK